MALDHLSTVFRRGRHLFGFRDGPDHRDSAAQALRTRGFHHAAPSEEHGDCHARHRHDCRLWLSDGNFHGVVQRRSFRKVYDDEPHVRSVRLDVLDFDPVQHSDSTGALDPTIADKTMGTVSHCHRGEYWHVAGALRYRRGELASRFYAFSLGNVLRDCVRLRGTRRHHWAVRCFAVSVYSAVADDFDI